MVFRGVAGGGASGDAGSQNENTSFLTGGRIFTEIWYPDLVSPKRKRAHEEETRVPFRFRIRTDRLNATGRLRQTSHLAGSFAGSRWKQLIDVFQLVTCDLGQNSHHGSNAVLLIVVLQDTDHFPVLVGQLLYSFSVFDVFDPRFTPVVESSMNPSSSTLKVFPSKSTVGIP